MRKYNIGILGATGAVGKEMLKVLEERNFPVENIRLLLATEVLGKSIFKGKNMK